MTKELEKEIKKWIRNFDRTQPKNLDIDTDTFEGSARILFGRVLAENKNKHAFMWNCDCPVCLPERLKQLKKGKTPPPYTGKCEICGKPEDPDGNCGCTNPDGLGY